MITEKELRIGNLIDEKIYSSRHEFSEVVGIQANGNINAIGVGWEGRSVGDKSSGIPLTEDWLVNKLGFKLMKESEYTLDTFKLGKVKIWNKNRDFSKLIYDTNGIRLKYVHQLQNLYFALTGEELTYEQ